MLYDKREIQFSVNPAEKTALCARDLVKKMKTLVLKGKRLGEADMIDNFR